MKTYYFEISSFFQQIMFCEKKEGQIIDNDGSFGDMLLEIEDSNRFVLGEVHKFFLENKLEDTKINVTVFDKDFSFIEASSETIGLAVKLALMDFCDKESAVYEDIIKPFLRHCGLVGVREQFALQKVILGICKKAIEESNKNKVKTDGWIFDAKCSGAPHFRFSFPKDNLGDIWSINEIDSLENYARGCDYWLFELGNINIINYVLGPYYYNLAHCLLLSNEIKEPLDINRVRNIHLYQYNFGRA